MIFVSRFRLCCIPDGDGCIVFGLDRFELNNKCVFRIRMMKENLRSRTSVCANCAKDLLILFYSNVRFVVIYFCFKQEFIMVIDFLSKF